MTIEDICTVKLYLMIMQNNDVIQLCCMFKEGKEDVIEPRPASWLRQHIRYSELSSLVGQLQVVIGLL